jgi:polyribonucleotide nucleotidyltransferase
MESEAKKFSISIDNKQFTFETGKIAGQAGGALTLQLGDTVVFAAATMSAEERPDIDFFPLTVDYEERMYAGGRIPGSFFRREGRPTDEAILTARLTDRPLRPLFPKDMRNDVQVIIYSLSSDGDNPIDILAVNAASAALMISDIPWSGPVGAVRIGRIENQFLINPTFSELEYSDLDLRIAGTRDAILMVECGANEVPEDIMVQAIRFGHETLQSMIEIQFEMQAKVGKAKRSYNPKPENPTLRTQLDTLLSPKITQILEQPYNKADRNQSLKTLEIETVEEFTQQGDNTAAEVKSIIEDTFKTSMRKLIIDQGKRLDGRSLDEIRPIWCEVDVSPRAHGSGLFTRGETQVLTMATLGTPREAQEIDSLTPFETKRYMHHYNFPPFSTGETKPLRGASRREIGHGALAERALLPVIPPESKFPYTLRLVSEVLSSNGSSSMASVCASTLALMDTSCRCCNGIGKRR